MRIRWVAIALCLLPFWGGCDEDGGVVDVPPPGTTRFEVTIENVSGQSNLPTPLSPGVWVVHEDPAPFFDVGQPDRGVGLERLAEDGDPASLAAAVGSRAGTSGTFTTPDGASEAAPIASGGKYTFTVDAGVGSKLSLATMFVESNDVFLAPGEAGIALFDDAGQPLAAREVSAEIELWDGGTEANQAPAQGPTQAPRQSGSDVGRAEGVVGAFDGPTRALPAADDIARITVRREGSGFVVAIENASATSGAIRTPLSPVFWMIHDDSARLFRGGEAASEALEALAEDGVATALATAFAGAAGVAASAAAATPVGATTARPAAPGERFEFTVLPDAQYRRMSFATMVVETNDAFVATPSEGIALLSDDGTARDVATIEDELRRLVAVWDAGSEANEVPGAGANQAPRQASADQGPADPTAQVRRYADATNDLDGIAASSIVEVTIAPSTAAPTAFQVTVRNRSADTVYPTPLTPVVFAVHDAAAAARMFTPGEPASAALERLAEDGAPIELAQSLGGQSGVATAAFVDTPIGGLPTGPLTPGSVYEFEVIPDAQHRFLSIATMVVNSNDTFLAFGPSGIALLDAAGARRTDAEIGADIATQLMAWDAGTEANQAGAAGPDQPSRQSAANTGPVEGDARVRSLDDPVWAYPPAPDLVRITIRPLP